MRPERRIYNPQPISCLGCRSLKNNLLFCYVLFFHVRNLYSFMSAVKILFQSTINKKNCQSTAAFFYLFCSRPNIRPSIITAATASTNSAVNCA